MAVQALVLAESLRDSAAKQAIYLPPFDNTFLHAFVGGILHLETGNLV